MRALPESQNAREVVQKGIEEPKNTTGYSKAQNTTLKEIRYKH